MAYFTCYLLGLITIPALTALLFWSIKDVDKPVDRWTVRGPFHQ